jgi:Family of unknown function (DUF6610)
LSVNNKKIPIKIMCHGRPTLKIAQRYGWLPGARYTNLRDIKGFKKIGMIDIDWKNYDFDRHLDAVKKCRPLITIARDVEDKDDLEKILEQANELNRYAEKVAIVPKDKRLSSNITKVIPDKFLLAYSVPTKYGATEIPLRSFKGRAVHLLGGRPDVQLQLSKQLNVYSFDGNRFTLDAKYGDYFAGECFKRHPEGGYYNCIRKSLRTISKMWKDGTRDTN